MNNDIQAFSLLAPESADACFLLSDTAVNDLSLHLLVEHLTASKDEQRQLLELLRTVPTDAAIIRYRQEIYADLKSFSELSEELYKILDEMQFYLHDERGTDFDEKTIWELVNYLRGLQNYVHSITAMQEILHGKTFASAGMQKLTSYIDAIYNDSGFAELTEDLKPLSAGIDQIHSLTLGVNLDENLQPVKAGILCLNKFDFRERGLLEKFLTHHRTRNPSDKELSPYSIVTHTESIGRPSPLMNNLTEIIEQMLPSVTKKLKRELKKYTDFSGLALAKLRSELLFYLRFLQMENRIRSLGMPCCVPQISEDETTLTQFYNIRLALLPNPTEIVCNDFHFNRDNTVLILTGPNRGGKTILTQAIGLTMLLFQHGVFAPCESGQIRICDGIFTHFPADENQTVTLGRLGEEAERFSQIWHNATSDSLLLMNESFASTSHSESLYIAEDVLKSLCCLGARTCFNTHMHELAEHPERLQSDSAVCGAASVIMGKRDGKDAFHIRYEKPNGKSYAHEIAQKYGITFEQLSKRKIGKR